MKPVLVRHATTPLPAPPVRPALPRVTAGPTAELPDIHPVPNVLPVEIIPTAAIRVPLRDVTPPEAAVRTVALREIPTGAAVHLHGLPAVLPVHHPDVPTEAIDDKKNYSF